MKIALLFFLLPFLALAQVPKKVLESTRVSEEIKIDGILDESVWQNVPIAQDFVMYDPGNGNPEPKKQKTQVKVLYSNEAIYVGAILYDSAPDSILKQLTPRDNYSQNNDWFGFFINPYNDGQSDFNFWVTAAGVQADSRTTSNGDDFSWNSVWKSAVQITDKGWVVEIEIPYMSLRFPEVPNSDWGLNMMRSIRRSREIYSWNFLDRNSGFTLEYQSGVLQGMKDIKPPIRLSFNPYLSAYADDFDGKSQYDLNAGLDLKYGINEAFTLDMTLIPDFGQVAFDPQFLNLSPFENRFDENRPFFTEGTNLFQKGDIFYSRRIGGSPRNITGVDLTGNDSVDIRQEYTQLLNATKISGRTKNNLGIGFLNAVTDNNYATFTDENGNETKTLTEPWTNYNVFVLDQRFNRKSSISFINTNVYRNGDSPDANVSALVASFFNSSGHYRLDASVKNSNIINNEEANISGFYGEIGLSDVAGNWRWLVNERIITDDYDVNDLGFQSRNNRLNHFASLSYQTITPTGPFNRYEYSTNVEYDFLFNPNVYERLNLSLNSFFLFRSFFAAGLNFNFQPVDNMDYFESREAGRKWRTPPGFGFNGFISSDYRKTFALDLNWFYSQINEFDSKEFGINIEPRVRISDQFFMILETNLSQNLNNYGFASREDEIGLIYFGNRNIDRIQNSISADFVFNPKASMRLNFRHLWTAVQYQEYYILLENGELQGQNTFEGINNINFNTLNIDLRFSWWFAPGSEMVILYRNVIASSSNAVQTNYWTNFGNLIDGPQQNNLSVRLSYFLDYNTLKKKIKKW